MELYLLKNFFLILSLMILSSVVAKADLQINELMQSNIDCILDDLNDFPDSWVELHNPDSVAVALSDYSISLKKNPAKAYSLPAQLVGPGEFLLIYCDKVGKNLHTNFRLESGKGGNIYLYRGGELVDSLENIKKQPAPNIAYGRLTEESDKWGYQDSPTPGSPNCEKIIKDILGNPVFSHTGAILYEPITLEMTLPEDAPEGTEIYYTKDGSEPSVESLRYSTPIEIAETTVIRAKLVCDGFLSPRSSVESYLLFSREMTLPVISLVIPEEYFYDEKIGIYVEGSYDESASIPNYAYEWRRPLNFEFFEAEGVPASINQLCETRVKGATSREWPLKPLVLYSNKRFGEKRFDYEFFPNDAPGLTDWKSLELRNAGGDFNRIYMRDILIQSSMGRNVNLDWQPYRSVVVMVNGEYKGLMHLRSRSNEDYVYTFYDGLEDIDMIGNWWEVKQGDIDSFNDFREFYGTPDHTFEEYQERMDTDSFANLFLMNLYFDNKDFPSNNFIMWKECSEDGKWNWIAKDTDCGLSLYNAPYDFPTLQWLYDENYYETAGANKAYATRLFRHLMATEEFKKVFLDKAIVYMGDFLRPENIISNMDAIYESFKNELPFHQALYQQSEWAYSKEYERVKKWIQNRSSFFYSHLAEFYGQGCPRPLIVNNDGIYMPQILINDIPLVNKDFDGMCFENYHIELRAEDGLNDEQSEVEENSIVAWRVRIDYGNDDIRTEIQDSPVVEMTIPEGCKSIIITALSKKSFENITSLEEIPDSFGTTNPFKLFSLEGRYLGSFERGEDLKSTLAPGIYLQMVEGQARKICIP